MTTLAIAIRSLSSPPVKECRASWRDGECMLADKDCPNPTKGDPSNCPRRERVATPLPERTYR